MTAGGSWPWTGCPGGAGCPWGFRGVCLNTWTGPWGLKWTGTPLNNNMLKGDLIMIKAKSPKLRNNLLDHICYSLKRNSQIITLENSLNHGTNFREIFFMQCTLYRVRHVCRIMYMICTGTCDEFTTLYICWGPGRIAPGEGRAITTLKVSLFIQLQWVSYYKEDFRWSGIK